jgi:hypothetical protein
VQAALIKATHTSTKNLPYATMPLLEPNNQVQAAQSPVAAVSKLV